MSVLVTGAAGFLGCHVARRLGERGEAVVGVDNLSPYYDVALKEARLASLADQPGFRFRRHDLAERAGTARLFAAERPRAVVHLAAQAGVRHGLDHPHDYVDANLVAFVNLLEGCRAAGVGHLLYASSSSVYGATRELPYSVADNVDHPLSLYAATKKANELLAHAYSHLWGLPTTGVRFFTVYGPWGRPDMAYFRFTEAILAGWPVELYGGGRQRRDFTYVDDAVACVLGLLDRPPGPGATAGTDAPSRVANVGSDRPVELLRLVEVLEDCLGTTVERRLLPAQPGDVPATWADVDDLERLIGFRPTTPIEQGLPRFVAWYRSFYGV